MSNCPEGHLETKFGTVRFAWTEAAHVHLSGEITVRGVDYTAGCHLYNTSGEWKHKGGNLYQELYLSRAASDPNRDKGASNSAREAVYAELVKVWTEYAAGHDDVGQHAERSHLTSQLDQMDGEIDELAATLAAKRAERHGILLELNKIGGRI